MADLGTPLVSNSLELADTSANEEEEGGETTIDESGVSIKVPNEFIVFRLRGPPAKLHVASGGDKEVFKPHHFFDLKSQGATDGTTAAAPADGGKGSRKEARHKQQSDDKVRVISQQEKELFVVAAKTKMDLFVLQNQMAERIYLMASEVNLVDREAKKLRFEATLERNLALCEKTIKELVENKNNRK